MPETFVLLHSPLVGPYTWSLTAAVLRQAGQRVLLPELPSHLNAGRPFWQQHAQAAARQVGRVQAPVLTAHSGAGPLLPAIAQALGRPAAGYLFVDAGLPAGGRCRLDTLGEAGPRLRAHLSGGGQFPDWTDEQLRASVPEPDVRARLLRSLRPQPLAYWEETLPEAPGWPDAPCGYLLFSAAYRADAEQANQSGWPVREQPGGHFDMLAKPRETAAALLELAVAWG